MPTTITMFSSVTWKCHRLMLSLRSAIARKFQKCGRAAEKLQKSRNNTRTAGKGKNKNVKARQRYSLGRTPFGVSSLSCGSWPWRVERTGPIRAETLEMQTNGKVSRQESAVNKTKLLLLSSRSCKHVHCSREAIPVLRFGKSSV